MKRSQGFALLFCMLMLFPHIPSGLPQYTVEQLSPTQSENQSNDSKALSSLTTQLEEQGYSMNIASVSPYNNSYQPSFIVRTESGNIAELTASEFNSYSAVQKRTLWGLGIRTKYGIFGFYTNYDQDPTFGHGQFITYPTFSNGSLPPLNKPLMGTFLRLWVRTGGTWYQNYITSNVVYQASSLDIRTTMTAINDTNYLELGWTGTLTLQGFDFLLYVGFRLNLNDENLVHIKTNVTSLDRAWEGLGMEYTIVQSSFWDGSDLQILYGTLETGDESIPYRLNQFRDMTQIIPGYANRTKIRTRDNTTIHEFNWDDLKAIGFNTPIFQIEQIQLPGGTQDYVLRVGMYSITPIPQGYTIEIDPSVTVTSDASRAVPLSVSRDSSDIPYVLALVGTTLYVFKGNDTNPGTFSNETVGDGNVISEVGYAQMIIGSYSATEYIWVVRGDDSTDLVLDRSTIAAFDFPSGSTITIDAGVSTSPYLGLDYGENRLLVLYREASYQLKMSNSTDGGATWSTPIDAWDGSGGSQVWLASVVAWDGSYWHLGAGKWDGSNADLYTKRWSSGGGLEWWDGDSWETVADTADGFGSHGTHWRGYTTHGAATANIIVFGRATATSWSYQYIHYSVDGGQTWSQTPGMGDLNYGKGASFTIKTEAGEVDDLYVWACNFDSNANDVNYDLYDYSGTSWGGWNLIWDTGDTSDTTGYFTGLLKQQNGWVDYAFQHYDDSGSTYYLNFTIYETGSVGGDETAPTFTYAGTTNSSNVEFGTDPVANWSITEANPDTYSIYANNTGTNVSKISGSYNNGDYKSWTYTNSNATNIGETIFVQIVANDTTNNGNSSIVYFNIVDTTVPTFSYTGGTNNSNVEYGTDFLGNWSITELDPNTYNIFSNSTGVNASKETSTYNNGDYKSWSYTNNNVTNIGNTLFIQIVADDNTGNLNNSIVYFTIVDTTVPTFTYTGSTNNSNVEINTGITGNWSITELAPDRYAIYSNHTSSNESQISGTYNNGDYKSWEFSNTNSSLIGSTIFIEIVANDTTPNLNTSIAYFNIIDNNAPTLSYTGTSNNTEVAYGTTILGNWSITDAGPDTYEIYSNHTSSNASQISGSYDSGDYKSWEFSNLNCSLPGSVIFIQMIANDTTGNQVTEIVYFTITNTAPQVSYTGTANESSIEWETETITLSWTVTEDYPDTYVIYYNQTGSNTTYLSGSYSGSVSQSYDPVLADVGNTIYFQLVVNDTCGLTNTSTVYFTITNTASPTVTITSPTNISYTGNVTITLSSSNGDLDTYWFSLYYDNGTAIETNTTWTESVERELDVDMYYIIAYCNDTAGLEDSETIWFTVTTEVAGGGGSSGAAKLADRLMEPILPDLDYPLLAILVIAVIGLVTQYSGPEPTAPQKQTLRQGFIILFVGLLLFTLAVLFDVFGMIRNALGFRPQLPSMPQSWGPYWERLMAPAVPLLGLPLLGIFLFAGMGLGTQYMAPEPKTAQKRRLKRIFVIILVALLVYATLILFNIPEILSDATSSARKTIAVINLAWLAPLVDRLMAPAFPFLPFDYPLVAILAFSGIGFYTQYISQPPATSGKRSFKRGILLVFGGLLIYSLFMLFNIFSVLGELWNFVVKLYT